jgi:hypothetical protein
MERKERSHFIAATSFQTEKDNQCPHSSRNPPHPGRRVGFLQNKKNWDPRLWKRLFFYHKNTQKSFFSGYIWQTNNLITHTCARQKEKSYRERTYLKFIENRKIKTTFECRMCCLKFEPLLLMRERVLYFYVKCTYIFQCRRLFKIHKLI